MMESILERALMGSSTVVAAESQRKVLEGWMLKPNETKKKFERNRNASKRSFQQLILLADSGKPVDVQTELLSQEDDENNQNSLEKSNELATPASAATTTISTLTTTTTTSSTTTRRPTGGSNFNLISAAHLPVSFSFSSAKYISLPS